MSANVRVFIDSNVILSGLISSLGPPRILMDLISLNAPLMKGMTGQYNVREVERNLAKKFPDLMTNWRRVFPVMGFEIVPIPPFEDVLPLMDKMSPKDAPVLASAIRGGARYLVTGDKKGFPKKVSHPVEVVSPREFLDSILTKLLYKKDVVSP